MQIKVECPKCNARFGVDEKYAGRKGPCPKCGATIAIPKASQAEKVSSSSSKDRSSGRREKSSRKSTSSSESPPSPRVASSSRQPPLPADDIQIHEPDEFQAGGKTSSGKPIFKPIARQDTQFDTKWAIVIVGSSLLLLGLMWILGRGFASQPTMLYGVYLGVVVLLSAPLTAAGYWIFADPDSAVFAGKELWIRSAICALLYCCVWFARPWLPDEYLEAAWSWAYIAPPILALGTGVSFVCFDLEPENSFLHFCLFFGITSFLKWTTGLGWF